MSAERIPAVGIDLGTTFSVIAHLDEAGRPTTLVNAEGELTTPSVVLFDGPDVVVGKEAIKAMATEAPRIADCAKRDLGQKLFHRSVDGREFPPEVIQAYILKKLADDARRMLGPFRHVVITVPAYFDETRRKATQDAGYLAGLEVLDIINEPTAAAVAFGYQQGFLRPDAAAGKSHKVLVYDLGGGTFDVTVMDIRGNHFVALATDGDVQLGGHDWDMRLVDLAADEFARQHGLDPRQDPAAVGRLWRECEDAKRTLSARGKATITCDYMGLAARVEVTRDQFEELTFDLLDRTRFTTRQTLKAAGMDWPQIDRLLLVGGSSRMPMVRQMLRELSGKDPDTTVSADEAVGHGAALHAGLILASSGGRPAPYSIRNINSHSLGVVGTDRNTGRKRNAILIPRNTPLPVTAERVFKTQSAGQESVLVQIVEGENAQPEHCTALGRCVIRGLPRELPAGSPIAVRFRYGADGRLTVYVRVADANQQVTQEISRDNSLATAELDEWRKRIVG
jgi:molecular chaperone DnaK